MGIIKNEITKAEYERLQGMSYAERTAEIKLTLSNAITCGYGYYGHYLQSHDDKYYLVYKVGDSCD